MRANATMASPAYGNKFVRIDGSHTRRTHARISDYSMDVASHKPVGKPAGGVWDEWPT